MPHSKTALPGCLPSHQQQASFGVSSISSVVLCFLPPTLCFSSLAGVCGSDEPFEVNHSGLSLAATSQKMTIINLQQTLVCSQVSATKIVRDRRKTCCSKDPKCEQGKSSILVPNCPDFLIEPMNNKRECDSLVVRTRAASGTPLDSFHHHTHD